MDSIKFDSGKNIYFLTNRVLNNTNEINSCLNPGNLCMVTGGRNLGRVGSVVSRERHPGSFDIVHIKDSVGHVFATR